MEKILFILVIVVESFLLISALFTISLVVHSDNFLVSKTVINHYFIPFNVLILRISIFFLLYKLQTILS